MSMCYLCDLCANYRGNVMGENAEYRRWIACQAKPEVFEERKAIDYGRDDPWKICKHFETKIANALIAIAEKLDNARNI